MRGGRRISSSALRPWGTRRVVVATKQHRGGEIIGHRAPSAPKCRTQIRVNRRRAVVGVDLGLAPPAAPCRMRAPIVVDAALGGGVGHVRWPSIWLGGSVLHGAEIAFADLPVILDHLPERGEREMKFRRVPAHPRCSHRRTSRLFRGSTAGRDRGRAARSRPSRAGKAKVLFPRAGRRSRRGVPVSMAGVGGGMPSMSISMWLICNGHAPPSSVAGRFSRSSRARTDRPCASRLSETASVSARRADGLEGGGGHLGQRGPFSLKSSNRQPMENRAEPAPWAGRGSARRCNRRSPRGVHCPRKRSRRHG